MEDEDEELLCGWPPCPTPDCEYGVCVWANTGLCFPCSMQAIGEEAMKRRWYATHDTPWEDEDDDT